EKCEWAFAVSNRDRPRFAYASFNQDLGEWELNTTVTMSNMLRNSGMDCENYSSTLIGWSENNPNVTGRSLGAEGLQYGTNAEAARDVLVNERGWTITGDSPSGTDCSVSSTARISNTEDIATPASDTSFDLVLRIFPNPAKQNITIESGEKQTIELIGLDGRTLLERKLQPGITTLDLTDYPSGVYLIHTGSGQMHKVVKQ
ncbi:MAG: T9SS type A sorting domain-containing protein, partial [Bacteroidota bacterium]